MASSDGVLVDKLLIAEGLCKLLVASSSANFNAKPVRKLALAKTVVYGLAHSFTAQMK
jgi:hypothetical protein